MVPVSPYLKPGDVLMQKLYHVEPAPPTASTKNATSASATDEAHGMSRSQEPPATVADVVPNELTLTYLKVLQRSEDYNRRAVDHDRTRFMNATSKPWRQLNDHVADILQQFQMINDTETDDREEVVDEEQHARSSLVRACVASHAAAKRHEDVRPTCPIIASGQRVHLDPSAAQGIVAEVRWRGGADPMFTAIVLDENSKAIGVASPTDIVKGPESTIAIRQFGALSGAVALGAGGSRDCFQICLNNLHKRAHRVVIALLCRRGADTLNGLQRCWLTLHEQGVGAGEKSKELYACRGLDSGPYGAIVLASLTRRTSDVWLFGCLNEAFVTPLSPPRLVSLLATYFQDPVACFYQHLSDVRERVIGQYMALAEDAARRVFATEDHYFREELAVIQRMEWQKLERRRLQMVGIRAFRARRDDSAVDSPLL